MIKKWFYRLKTELWFYRYNRDRNPFQKASLTKSATKELINRIVKGDQKLMFSCASYPIVLSRKVCEYLGVETEVVSVTGGFELRRNNKI